MGFTAQRISCALMRAVMAWELASAMELTRVRDARDRRLGARTPRDIGYCVTEGGGESQINLRPAEIAAKQHTRERTTR